MAGRTDGRVVGKVVVSGGVMPWLGGRVVE